jgi:WD40 repeat protein
VHAVNLDNENDEGKCIARSNGGMLIATGGSAGILRLWRFDSSKCIASVVAHSGSINGVSFTPDDRQVLTVGDDGCISVWCVYNDDA